MLQYQLMTDRFKGFFQAHFYSDSFSRTLSKHTFVASIAYYCIEAAVING